MHNRMNTTGQRQSANQQARAERFKTDKTRPGVAGGRPRQQQPTKPRRHEKIEHSKPSFQRQPQHERYQRRPRRQRLPQRQPSFQPQHRVGELQWCHNTLLLYSYHMLPFVWIKIYEYIYMNILYILYIIFILYILYVL